MWNKGKASGYIFDPPHLCSLHDWQIRCQVSPAPCRPVKRDGCDHLIRVEPKGQSPGCLSRIPVICYYQSPQAFSSNENVNLREKCLPQLLETQRTEKFGEGFLFLNYILLFTLLFLSQFPPFSPPHSTCTPSGNPHTIVHVYGLCIYKACPECIQLRNMKNGDIYWRRYKIQETLYTGQWPMLQFPSK